MKSFLRLAVAALSLTFAVGCAKTDAQKGQEAKATADSAIADLKSTAAALDKMGTPVATWSEEDMNKYEGLLQALEKHVRRVEAADGKDGVVISGTYSLVQIRLVVAQNTQVLKTARAAKSTAAKELSSQVIEGISLLADETPDESWTDEKLAAFETTVARAEANLAEIESQLGQSETMSEAMEALKKSYREKHHAVTKVRQAKAAKSSSPVAASEPVA